MTPYWSGENVTLHHGDCIVVMQGMPENSVDAIVCDPPYGLEFMGKDWDAPWKQAGSVLSDPASVGGFQDGNGGNPYSRSRIRYGVDGNAFQEWCQAWATEALRVLKPGGHMLAAGSSRTHHRLTSGIEDAGFEIRDTIAWMHTTGGQQTDILNEWERWAESAKFAGIQFDADGSVPAHVLVSTNLKSSPAHAVIADLNSSAAHHTHEGGPCCSALSPADAPTTESRAPVIIAGWQPGNHAATQATEDSTAPTNAPAWLNESIAGRLKAGIALRIWLGSKQSTKPAATAALSAALTDDLKLITCAQSKTFQSYDMISQTVCVSATTVTTTAFTAACLISFTADMLANGHPSTKGGDATEAAGGPLVWVYGSGFP